MCFCVGRASGADLILTNAEIKSTALSSGEKCGTYLLPRLNTFQVKQNIISFLKCKHTKSFIQHINPSFAVRAALAAQQDSYFAYPWTTTEIYVGT